MLIHEGLNVPSVDDVDYVVSPESLVSLLDRFLASYSHPRAHGLHNPIPRSLRKCSNAAQQFRTDITPVAKQETSQGAAVLFRLFGRSEDLGPCREKTLP